MKELEFKTKDEVKFVKEVKQEKQTVLVNSIYPHEGHKCFEYNAITNCLSLAVYIETAISFEAAQNGEIAPKRKVNTKENCHYVTALNFNNAVKRLSKILGRKIIPHLLTPSPQGEDKTE